MEIQTRRQGAVYIIDVDGRLTIDSGSGAYDAILAALAAGEKKILLDLDGVPALDSSGVGELMAGLTSARNRGAALKLLKLSPRVGKVLTATQLIGLFEIFDDEGPAVRSFG
jgi:anti-sigma B factor antagonist